MGGRTTLLRAPRMDAKSGVWLEGLTRGEAQALFVVVPWAGVVGAFVINLALYVLQVDTPSLHGGVNVLKRAFHAIVALLCISYIPITILCERSLCCCTRAGPLRSREGWLALLGLLVAAAISTTYSGGLYGWNSNHASSQTHFVFVHGSFWFRVAATGEFFLQLCWLWAADRLRFGSQPTPAYKHWGRFCLAILWLLTFSGPMEQGEKPRAFDHALVMVGYSARVGIFFWCVAHLGKKCACRSLADWRKLEGLPCSPGRCRLRYLAYFVVTRPSLLVLINLPLGYPLEAFAWFAATVRCGLFLLLAIALRPAPRSAMGEHPLEAETRNAFDISLAMRMCDYAWEAYNGPPLPTVLAVTGASHHRLNGDYRLDGRDATGAAMYSRALTAAAFREDPEAGVGDAADAPVSGEPQRLFLRKTLDGEWEISSHAATKSGERFAYVRDDAMSPLLIEGLWFECGDDNTTTSNAEFTLYSQDQVGTTMRRFEKHGDNAAYDAHWLLVETESRFLADGGVSIYVAFRGTNSVQNMLTDARISMRPLVSATAPSSPEPSEPDAASFSEGAPPEAAAPPQPRGASLMEMQVRRELVRLARASPIAEPEPSFPSISSASGRSSFMGWDQRHGGDARAALMGADGSEQEEAPGLSGRLSCCCWAFCCLPFRLCRLLLFPFVVPSDQEDDDEEFTSETLERVRVHAGFLSAYEAVRDDVIALLQNRLALCHAEGKQVRLYITGHSLGGALASIFALDVATSGGTGEGANIAGEWRSPSTPPMAAAPPQPVVYTFGCPRVGNAAFRSIYNTFVPETFRVVVGRDAVPALPPSVAYRQLGREVWADDAGELTFAMSWAMRRILPARDSPSYHTLASYFRLLGRSYRRLRGHRFRSSFRNDPALRDLAEDE